MRVSGRCYRNAPFAIYRGLSKQALPIIRKSHNEFAIRLTITRSILIPSYRIIINNFQLDTKY
jgi:hypothetical protein